MNTPKDLLDRNRAWSERVQREDPGFFARLAQHQTPQYLWIGCSDSRVPANQIVDLVPGELFVHRNIANVVVHTDLNCLSVLQFAVDVLQVRHVLVVGHYGCGGVHAALTCQRLGLSDNWLRHVRDVADKHQECLQARALRDQHSSLCELNVLEQVVNVSQTTVVDNAWARGQSVSIHGWVYSLENGRVNDLGINVDTAEQLPSVYQKALERIRRCEAPSP